MPITISRKDFRMIEEVDTDPDLSYLGKYTDRPKGWYLDRKTGIIHNDKGNVVRDVGYEPGVGRHEYRYFEFGSNHLPHNPKSWAHVSAKDKKKVKDKYGSLKEADMAYAVQDFELMEQYARGDRALMLISAAVDIDIPGAASQTLQSGFVGGIDSDDEQGKKQIFKEQSDELVDILKEMGVKVKK